MAVVWCTGVCPPVRPPVRAARRDDGSPEPLCRLRLPAHGSAGVHATRRRVVRGRRPGCNKHVKRHRCKKNSPSPSSIPLHRPKLLLMLRLHYPRSPVNFYHFPCPLSCPNGNTNLGRFTEKRKFIACYEG